MRTLLRMLSVVVVTSSVLGLAACGGRRSSNSPGVGSITLTSFAPSALPGCAATAFTITGTNFETVTGTTALVTFTATSGAPFNGSNVAVVTANVINDTTITGTSPEVTLCGVASISVTIDVTLESGVKASTTGAALPITITAPTITSISPTSIPAAIPTPFSLTGTGFTPGPVTVRFTSANAGDLNFADGTANFVDVQATATSPMTITGESPLARACTADFTASVQIFERDGCCTAPTANTFVTFVAPAITSPAFGVFGIVPNPLTLVGTNFGVAGEVGVVRLSTVGIANGTIFGNGSFQTIDIPGTVGVGGTSVAFTTPVTALCSPTTAAITSLRWIAPRGESCAVGSGITFNSTSITIASAPVIPALAVTPEIFTFSSALPPIGTQLTLVFTSTSAGTPAIFNSATATTYTNSAAVVASATTVTATAPAATLCGIDTATASVTAFWPGGSCSISSTTLLTYQRPSLATASPGGIQNPLLPVASFPNNNMFALAGQEPFVLNALPGRSFGPVGSVVEVRFSTATPIWQGGASTFDTAVGQVTSATTITGATPATVSGSLAIIPVTVQAFWLDGTCSDTTIAQYTQTSQRTFATGTSIYTINQNGIGAPALIGAPIGGIDTPVLDPRRNRLYVQETLPGTFLRTYDTAQTMLAAPVVPSLVSTSANAAANQSDLALADRQGKLWNCNGSGPVILVFDQKATNKPGWGSSVNGDAFTVNPPGGSACRRLLYNATSGEMVVALNAPSQIAIYDAANGNLNALFAVPNVGAAAWNFVTTIRPGASGTARAYMLYDDPAVANPDIIGTLSFSTGVITNNSLIANNFNAASPGALAYDALRGAGVLWGASLGGNLSRFDPVTVGLIVVALVPGNVPSISVDPFDDRYYLSNTGTGNVNAINAATLTVVGSVVVPVAGKNASTTP